MSDDILGHEHLDHGKHLHKHGHAHGPTWLRARVGKPEHIGTYLGSALRRKTKRRAHHDKHHSEYGHAHDYSPGYIERLGKTKVIGGALSVFVLLLLSVVQPWFLLVVVALIATALLERLKEFTTGAPIDFEVLSICTAVLASQHVFVEAFILACIGPVTGELTHGHLSEYVWIKVGSLLVTGVAAAVLGTQPWQLFIAILFGLGVQFVGMLIARGDVLMNLLRRLTNGGWSAYLAFIVVPLLTAAL